MQTLIDVAFSDNSPVVIWQLTVDLKQQLSPSRLSYVLQPDSSIPVAQLGASALLTAADSDDPLALANQMSDRFRVMSAASHQQATSIDAPLGLPFLLSELYLPNQPGLWRGSLTTFVCLFIPIPSSGIVTVIAVFLRGCMSTCHPRSLLQC